MYNNCRKYTLVTYQNYARKSKSHKKKLNYRFSNFKITKILHVGTLNLFLETFDSMQKESDELVL